jgi:hypothetical protein
VATKGISFQIDVRNEGVVGDEDVSGGSQGEKVVKGVSIIIPMTDKPLLIETCPLGGKDCAGGGPGLVQESLIAGGVRVVHPHLDRAKFTNRSKSLPPFRPTGSFIGSAQSSINNMDFSDSISLVEERGGATLISAMDVEEVHQSGENEVKAPVPKPRGRPRKRGARTKPNKLYVPKFIQLAEAVKEGGGNHLGRRRKGGIPLKTQNNNPINSDGISVDASTCSGRVEVATVAVPLDPPGPILEVVLPPITNSSRSGIELLLHEGTGDNCNTPIFKDQKGALIFFFFDKTERAYKL